MKKKRLAFKPSSLRRYQHPSDCNHEAQQFESPPILGFRTENPPLNLPSAGELPYPKSRFLAVESLIDPSLLNVRHRFSCAESVGTAFEITDTVVWRKRRSHIPQLRLPGRTLRHGWYMQGALHCAVDEGLVIALRYGPSSLACRRHGGWHDPLSGTSDGQLGERNTILQYQEVHTQYQEVHTELTKWAPTASRSN